MAAQRLQSLRQVEVAEHVEQFGLDQLDDGIVVTLDGLPPDAVRAIDVLSVGGVIVAGGEVDAPDGVIEVGRRKEFCNPIAIFGDVAQLRCVVQRQIGGLTGPVDVFSAPFVRLVEVVRFVATERVRRQNTVVGEPESVDSGRFSRFDHRRQI